MINQERYKNIFDSIESNSEITLDSLNQRKHELKKKRLRNSLYSFAACAALFLGSNAVSYAKTGEFWVAKAFNFKTGSGLEVTVDNTSPDETKTTIKYDDANARDYYSVENGRLYFVFNDIKQDITDECSEDDYFKYEYTDEDSYRHVIIVGGTVDNPGWAEFMFDKDGNYIFNNMSIKCSDSEDSEEISATYNIDETDNSGNYEEDFYIEEYSDDVDDDITNYDVYEYNENGDIKEIIAMSGEPNWLIQAKLSLGIPTGIPELDFAE
ncbi:MAG: hypothetical protein IJT72_10155 [Lachnospiraceae bacterium]|nr:hypothetical protein [Lachnospiraceae bacterium]